MKILLIGWFGAGNMGDEAILISELLFLRKEIADVEFHILSFDANRTRKLTAQIPEVKRIIRFGAKRKLLSSNISGLFKSFGEVDFVLIGGGGLFQDIYNFYPIPFFTAMTLLARCFKKPVILYCVGFGPIHAPINKTLCRWAANAAHLISVRDKESASLLRGLGVTRSISVSSDPVFLLEPVKEAAADLFLKLNHLDSPDPLIGVCVQDLLFWSDSNKQILAETLDAAVERWGAKVVFLPFGVYHDGWFHRALSDSVDMAASKKIAGLMRSAAFIASTGKWSPQELLVAMGKMSVVISMRLHGLIMAMRMGTPVIALTYGAESKIRNLMKQLTLEDNLFDVSRLEQIRLLERMEKLLQDSDEHKKQIYQRLSLLQADAKESNRQIVDLLMHARPLYRGSHPNSARQEFKEKSK
jgi:polysaccharide pyruvyl transferase CsaB